MSDLYNTDVVAWADQQADVLRRLAAGETPNEPPDWASPARRRRGATNERPRCTQPPARPEHVGRVSAAARRVVRLLLGHTLVDAARRALRLVLRVVPSARSSAARSGALGAGTGGVRAAAVKLTPPAGNRASQKKFGFRCGEASTPRSAAVRNPRAADAG